MASFGIGDILSGLGDVAGIFGGISGINSSQKTLGGLSDQLSQLLSQQTGISTDLINQYLQQVAPQLNSLGGTGTQQGQQYAGLAGGAGTMLQSDPYLSSIMGGAKDLSSFTGLTPEELNSLTTGAGNAALSAARTMGEQVGGVANPFEAEQQLVNQAGTTASDTAVQLGGPGANLRLAPLRWSSPGNEWRITVGQQGVGPNLFSGLSGTGFNTALGALGTQAGALGQGISGLTQASGTVGNLLGQSLQTAGQTSGGGLSSIISGLTGLGGLFGL